MKIIILPWSIKIETHRYYVFLSVDKFDWNVIHFLPSLVLDRHFKTGSYMLYASFLNVVAMLDIFRKDKFQA